MKKIPKSTSILFFLLLSFKAFGQTGLENFFEKFFQQFDEQMTQEFKRFEKQLNKSGPFLDFESLFKDNKKSNTLKNSAFWRETKSERILVLKINAAEGTPFDINIKNGQIVIKGTVEEKRETHGPHGKSISKSIYHFQKGPFPIPKDVDPEKAKVEKQTNEILIRFPKIKSLRPSTRPLPAEKGDLTI